MRRRHRLRSASDFALLRKDGRRYHHPLLILVARPNKLSVSRFAFSASRHVGKATTRNRAKRLLRESVRRFQDRIPDGWDLLFIARPGAAVANFEQVQAAVSQTLARAHMMDETA